MTTGQCHVLMLNCAGPLLHLVRAMRLARQLIDRGSRITLLIAEDEMRSVEGKLFHGWQDGIDIVEVASPPLEIDGISTKLNTSTYLEHSCLPYLEKQLEEKSNGKAGGISVMVVDAFLAWTQDWANKLHIPRYVMMPTASDSLMIVDLPRLLSQGLLESGKDELISVDGLPTIHLSETYPWISNGLIGLRNIPQVVMAIAATMIQAKGVLINSCYELEHGAIDAYRTKFGLNIYAMMPPTYLSDNGLVSGITGSSHPCLQWLDSQPASSVLFVAFGSWSLVCDEQVRELALGLESSGVPFLCCLPQSSTHPFTLINGFETRVKKRGMVFTEWVPQRHILSHPATKGFLSHCGWNSTIESICRGVPFIALPNQANQGLICRLMVDYHKVALEIKKGADGIARMDEVRKKVLSLMVENEGQELKNRVELLRSRVQASIREGGPTCQNLQHVLELISTHVA